MPETLAETNTRLAALPTELDEAKENVETSLAAFQSAHSDYAAALNVLHHLGEEQRMLRRHKEALHGLPA
jgi:hypothetical protein